ncbi:Phosphatidylinositol 4-phosphate 5-kinase 6 [Symbiodinium microadriaticum]|uniref:Phosphatidylinositol 4-phosphate 5-kinase 6 n=1 Tax=Symbiodinium microadriaticum TaxID=2951 RepID=A0A1Q9DL58_SYMMI|nr:Phosphatidylinositol 4-phosphate 5-kinase 6 [Symbiodinium microadriaticum]
MPLNSAFATQLAGKMLCCFLTRQFTRFKMFDAHGLSGTVKFDQFLEVIEKKSRVGKMTGSWYQRLPANMTPFGEFGDSLSYCEFLAVLLPPIEDVFEDAGEKAQPEDLSPLNPKQQWIPSKPISEYIVRLQLGGEKRTSTKFWATQIFNEHTKVRDAVLEMARNHMRWCLVKYEDGSHKFFDYFDINHKLLEVGVFSAPDFLHLALRYTVFDRRSTILQVSVQQDEPLLHALQNMKAAGLSICPTTSRELSGDLGGEVDHSFAPEPETSGNFGSSGRFDALGMPEAYQAYRRSVCDFLSWRTEAGSAWAPLTLLSQFMRVRRILEEFGCRVAVQLLGVTWCAYVLHTLALRLLASKLSRLFLASDEIARIVGIVSSRACIAFLSPDPSKSNEQPPSQKYRRKLEEVAPCASSLYEAVQASVDKTWLEQGRRRCLSLVRLAQTKTAAKVERPTLLSQTMEDQLRRAAPYLTAKQVEHVLRSSQLEPSLRRKVASTVDFDCDSCATAIRASFAGTDERNKVGGSRILQGKAVARTGERKLFGAKVLKEQKAVATELCRLQVVLPCERQKSLAEQAGLSNAGAQAATGNVSMPNRLEERPFDAGEVRLAADGLPPSHSAAIGRCDFIYVRSLALLVVEPWVRLTLVHRQKLDMDAFKHAKLNLNISSFLISWLPMFFDAWPEFQCLACCSNADSVVTKDEVPAEKLVPVATVFSRPADVTLADPSAEEVLQSRPMVCRRPRVQQASGDEEDVPVEVIGDDWPQQPPEKSFGSLSARLQNEDVQRIVVTDLKNFKGHIRSPDQRDMFALIMARFANAEVQDKLSPLLGRVSMTKSEALRETGVTAAPPKGMLPIIATWRSLKTEYYYFYFELGDRSDIEFPQEPLAVEHWRCGRLLRIATAFLCNDTLSQVPAAFGRLTDEEQAGADDFEDGDGLVIPVVSRRWCVSSSSQGDEASFGGLTLEKTLRRYQDACERVQQNQRMLLEMMAPFSEASCHGARAMQLRPGPFGHYPNHQGSAEKQRLGDDDSAAFSAGGVAEADAGGGATKAQVAGDATYEGGWLNGQKHGQGSLTLKDGSKYVGQFKNDKKDGSGVYHYPSGAKYTGQWVNDLQEGDGKEEWADGSVFEGQFKAGAKHGRGKFVWSTLCRYEGEFDNNDMHGEGVYTWNDGRGYSGQWNRNTMAPRGKMWWSDGRTYEGEFLDGRKHGEGTLKWPDGRSYCGQWQDGKQHGTAIARTAKGLRRQSNWKDGKFVSWVGGIIDDDGTETAPDQEHSAPPEGEGV